MSHGSSGLGYRNTVLCSWAENFTHIVPLFTELCKCVPANCQGGAEIPLVVHATETGICSGLMAIWP